MNIEPLEPRQLLSASLHDGLLTITGTRRSDDFQIRVNNRSAPDGLEILVNHRQQLYFDPAKVKKISINLGLGDDNVTFDTVTLTGGYLLHVDVPVALHGGGGNDSLIGSTRPDLLDGGDGNDSIFPRGDDDTALGGAGDDHIFAFGNHNLLRGGAGNDTISEAGPGSNTLSGDAGNDSLTGGDGDDLLTGGPGADTLNGGRGYDRIFGNRGTDAFVDFNDSPHQRKDRQPDEPLFTPRPVDPIMIIN